MESSLVHVNFPHERVALAKFSELFLALLCLKKNYLKIIFMPKRHTLGCHSLLPFGFPFKTLSYLHSPEAEWIDRLFHSFTEPVSVLRTGQVG